MAFARTADSDQRAELFGRLVLRNRVIWLLRVLVPVSGLVLFGGLVLQIYIANIARQYGVSGIRIDRGNLVVDTPKYSGTGKDGTRYVVTAAEARTPVGQPEDISLTDATFQYIRPGRPDMFANAVDASMNTATQIVDVPGIMEVSDEDGLTGTLEQVEMNLETEITTASGPVDITLSDGTLITGSSMVHDGTKSLWTFTDATVIVNDLPEAEE